MRIIERRISAREDGGGHIVEFVYEDGKRASIVLSDADSVGLGQDELIRKAERLLDQIDASEARGDMPPYGIGDGPNSLVSKRPGRNPWGQIPRILRISRRGRFPRKTRSWTSKMRTPTLSGSRAKDLLSLKGKFGGEQCHTLVQIRQWMRVSRHAIICSFIETPIHLGLD